MSGKPAVYDKPEYVEFTATRGPVLGFHSTALWREFCDKFGVAVSLTSFRNFAARVKGDRHLPSATTPMPTIDEVSRVEQERLRENFDKDLLAQLKRQKATTDALIEAIAEIVPKVPKAEVPRLSEPKTDGRAQTALLILSDIHIGQVVNSSEVQGLGGYNFQVFKQRKAALINAVRSIIRHHQVAHPVKRLHIAWLGDNLEGDQIYPSQRLNIDLDLMQQVFGGVEELAEIPLSFLDLVDHIDNECVVGNHGRVGRKGDNKTYVNWDYVLYRTLQLKLGLYEERIRWHIPESFFTTPEIEGWNWLFWHGDDVKSWAGIPWYGLQRAVGNWIQIFNHMGRRFDYAAVGHFHQEAKVDQAASEFFINGSWVGTNEYSLRLRSANTPKQTLLFIHPVHGVTARYPVQLERPSKAEFQPHKRTA